MDHSEHGNFDGRLWYSTCLLCCLLITCFDCMSDARYSLLRRQADMKMAQRLVYKVYAVFLRYANDVYFTSNLRQNASVPSCLLLVVLYILIYPYFFLLILPSKESEDEMQSLYGWGPVTNK